MGAGGCRPISLAASSLSAVVIEETMKPQGENCKGPEGLFWVESTRHFATAASPWAHFECTGAHSAPHTLSGAPQSINRAKDCIFLPRLHIFTEENCLTFRIAFSFLSLTP
jgi:hypothetical protein